MTNIVTRIAPSPTGTFQLGNCRTALLNYLKARSCNGKFILRIDDTDLERSEQKHIDYIYKVFDYLGLDYDITFKQSERKQRHIEVAKKVGTLSDDGSYILDMGEYNMVIVRSNGVATYNFSSVLDDYDYDVNHIIRGNDHESNLPKQMKIWNEICKVEGQKPFPKVEHACLLMDKGIKLSKRSGVGTLDKFTNYDKRVILNWLLKYGWSHPDSQFDKKYKTLSLNEMIKLYPEGNITNRNCNIDMNRLEFLAKAWKNRDRVESQEYA